MPATQVRIVVPERRSQAGRTITVSALLLPSTAQHPGHPIVFLMGGPGIPGSVMAPIPPYFTLFQRLREIGDVVGAPGSRCVCALGAMASMPSLT